MVAGHLCTESLAPLKSCYFKLNLPRQFHIGSMLPGLLNEKKKTPSYLPSTFFLFLKISQLRSLKRFWTPDVWEVGHSIYWAGRNTWSQWSQWTPHDLFLRILIGSGHGLHQSITQTQFPKILSLSLSLSQLTNYRPRDLVHCLTCSPWLSLDSPENRKSVIYLQIRCHLYHKHCCCHQPCYSYINYATETFCE